MARALVPDRDGAAERGDADHLRSRRYARGPDARRHPAHAQRRVAQPAAVSVDRCRPGRAGLLFGARPDAARARHDRHWRLADVRAARRDQPRLRQPRALRHREDARRRRWSLDEGRARRRHQRRDAAGLEHGADGLRPPSAQPHRARRRDSARNGRQLVGASLVDLNAGVYAAELWSPATGQWRTLAAMQITRQYHSTALLLPDGRVLSAGGGICGTCDTVGYLAKNAEIFSPPYLFQADGTLAPRPAIDAAPASATYGASIEITTASPGRSARSRSSGSARSRTRTTWSSATSRCPSPPARRASRRLRRPTRTSRRRGRTCSSSSTPTACLLWPACSASKPGHSPPAVTLTQPANGATFAAPATVGLAATASDADGTVTKVEFFNGAAKLGEDTTAPYSFTWSGVATGTYTLTARATDNLGASTTSAQATITVKAHKCFADREHHLTGGRRDLLLEAHDHDRGERERSRRECHEGRVPRRRDRARSGHDSAVLIHVEERAVRKSHSDRARYGQRGSVTSSGPVGITVQTKR